MASQIQAGPCRHINWVVKASKLCNLRCAYCYEWNDLAKRERISLQQWERLLHAIRKYHDLRWRVTGEKQRSNIIWHGGEPTLLPSEYINDVLALERAILGDRLAAGEFRNALQTNLFALTPAMIDLFKQRHFDLGVSLDLVEGTRLTLGGRASEDRVVRNLELLREHDIGMGAIVVLAAHTSNHVIDIYDYFESLRMPVRFLPLFQSPRSGESGIHISDAGIQAALRRVFMHWVDRPAPVHVSPLLDHVYTVLLSLRGESQPPYDRRISGEWALLVNTDGELYQRIDAYERERSLGNVFVEDIESIINSERYAASLDRDDVLWNRYCKGCEFDGPCTSMDVFESPRPDLGAKRCAISYRLNQFILRHFVSRFEDPAAGAGAFIGLCNASTRRSADAKALVG